MSAPSNISTSSRIVIDPNPTPSEAKTMKKGVGRPVDQKINNNAPPLLSGAPNQQSQMPGAPQNNNLQNQNIIALEQNQIDDQNKHVEFRQSTADLLETVRKTKTIFGNYSNNVCFFYANIGKLIDSKIADVEPLKNYIPPLVDFRKSFNEHLAEYDATRSSLIKIENQVKQVCLELTQQIASNKKRIDLRADFTKDWNECCFSNIIVNYDSLLIESMLGVFQEIKGLTQEANALMLSVRDAKGQFRYVKIPLPGSLDQLKTDYQKYYDEFIQLHNKIKKPPEVKQIKTSEDETLKKNESVEVINIEVKKEESEKNQVIEKVDVVTNLANILKELRKGISLKEDALNSFEFRDKEKKAELESQLNAKLAVVNKNRESCEQLLCSKLKLCHDIFVDCAHELNVVEYALTNRGVVPTDSYIKLVGGTAKVEFLSYL